MPKFVRKNFSIREGKYTGPKDMDQVPGALEVVGKSALGGAGLGAVVGHFMENKTALGGALTGAKWGGLAGVGAKLFLNHLHNPMKEVKFQDVDKVIRREFGIWRAAGVTVGDSLDRRATLDEKFGFNDRDMLSYKLSVAIADGRFVMYTFDMDDKTLEKLSDILDYYCKKYTGMDYRSTLINRKLNSYSIDVIFTNYQVISNFLMEVSNTLGFKINLLNSKAVIDFRVKEKSDEVGDIDSFEGSPETKQFSSIKKLNRTDLINLFGKATSSLLNFVPVPFGSEFGAKKTAGYLVLGSIASVLDTLSDKDKSKLPIKQAKGNLGNQYLGEALKRFVEGYHYSVGDAKSKLNMSLVQGVFMVTATKGKISKQVDSEWYEKYKADLIRKDLGGVIFYSYSVNNKSYFENILKDFVNLKLIPNIIDK